MKLRIQKKRASCRQYNWHMFFKRLKGHHLCVQIAMKAAEYAALFKSPDTTP